MMEFDRIIAQADNARVLEHPVRTELTEVEIKQIADSSMRMNSTQPELMLDGVGDDPLFADIHRQLTEAGVEFETPFKVEKNRLWPVGPDDEQD